MQDLRHSTQKRCAATSVLLSSTSFQKSPSLLPALQTPEPDCSIQTTHLWISSMFPSTLHVAQPSAGLGDCSLAARFFWRTACEVETDVITALCCWSRSGGGNFYLRMMHISSLWMLWFWRWSSASRIRRSEDRLDEDHLPVSFVIHNVTGRETETSFRCWSTIS